MSSTNHTQHYGLSQWEPEDAFLREDFNRDFQKIDGTLAEKVETAFGSYIGDGETQRDIALGFSPKAVLLGRGDSVASDIYRCYGGLALAGKPVVHKGLSAVAIQVTDTGFQVGYRTGPAGYEVATNTKNETYYYLVIK